MDITDDPFELGHEWYRELLRLFEEARILMPFDGTKKRAEWNVAASAIKVPMLLDCPVCNQPEVFMINPLDHGLGYCWAEDLYHRVQPKHSSEHKPVPAGRFMVYQIVSQSCQRNEHQQCRRKFATCPLNDSNCYSKCICECHSRLT